MPRSLPGDWDGLVVMCAGSSWDDVWFPDKHMATRLTQWAPVLYVDPPVSWVSVRRNPSQCSAKGFHLGIVRPGLARLTPVALPGMHRSGMHVITEGITRGAIRRAVKSMGGQVAAVIVATQSMLFGACGERLRVLYATDDFVAAAALMGVPKQRLRRNEARQARAADLVVTVSSNLADKWRGLGHEPVLIPNGCDDLMYARTDQAPLPDDIDLPPPVAGFIGHLSDRIDLSLLEAVAARDHSLLLVGPRQATFDVRRVNRLLARPNVRWVGPKPFEALPSFLRLIDVGLTPYGDTAFNRSSFPLKTLEYLAAGRAVVATDLPAVRWLGTDLVEIASGPEEFADAVERCSAQPRTTEIVARRRAFATRHSWTARAGEFAAALGFDTRARPPSELNVAWT